MGFPMHLATPGPGLTIDANSFDRNSGNRNSLKYHIESCAHAYGAILGSAHRKSPNSAIKNWYREIQHLQTCAKIYGLGTKAS